MSAVAEATSRFVPSRVKDDWAKWKQSGLTTKFVDKPTKPLPEHFGLSDGLIEKMEAWPKTPKYVQSVFAWAMMLSFPVVAIVCWLKTNDIPTAIFVGLVAPVGVMTVSLAAYFIVAICSSALKRTEHDYKSLASYKEACNQYNLELCNWARQQLDYWKRLNGREFEYELAVLFNKRGFRVEVVGGPGDGGIDLILGSSDKTILVQCKALKSQVGPGAVRDLFGVLQNGDTDEAWLVSRTGFTKAAIAFSNGKRIRLIQISELVFDNQLSDDEIAIVSQRLEIERIVVGQIMRKLRRK